MVFVSPPPLPAPHYSLKLVVYITGGVDRLVWFLGGGGFFCLPGEISRTNERFARFLRSRRDVYIYMVIHILFCCVVRDLCVCLVGERETNYVLNKFEWISEQLKKQKKVPTAG